MRLQWGFLIGPCDRLSHTIAHSALVAMLPSNAGTGDLGELFVECSSTAFGLASPPVSPRSIRPDHCRRCKTNPRASLSHCVRSSRSPAISKTGSGGYGRGTANRKWMSRTLIPPRLALLPLRFSVDLTAKPPVLRRSDGFAFPPYDAALGQTRSGVVEPG